MDFMYVPVKRLRRGDVLETGTLLSTDGNREIARIERFGGMWDLIWVSGLQYPLAIKPNANVRAWRRRKEER